ncbi:hypothetical protein E2562_017603 [Oryza meyeriana var. granulata]|uniref:Uncharacterized protein n=1 Tax=Oryza meyeriana var. granulata TaxID=110450 RepID=A0A6G1BMY0_9ORYZ|nr:hypothetical protein E2562_017603 [Oryza meyeriana var. granulata]
MESSSGVGSSSTASSWLLGDGDRPSTSGHNGEGGGGAVQGGRVGEGGLRRAVAGLLLLFSGGGSRLLARATRTGRDNRTGDSDKQY